jgi:hypothetical protein
MSSAPPDPHPELTARMAQCWRDNRVTERELSGARQRLRIRRRLSRQRPRVRPLVWAVLTVFFGGVVYAANGLLELRQAEPSPPAALPASPSPTATASRGGLVPPRMDKPEAVVPEAVVPEAVVPEAVASEPVAGEVAEPPRAPRRALPAEATVRRERRGSASPQTTPREESVPLAAVGAWAAVNAALGRGDTAAALSALDVLNTSADARTRDAARLLSAQILVSQGERGRARGILVELSQAGATSNVREQAARLLDAGP